MENLKIIAISDLHGYVPTIEQPFDILLICGDICPAHDHYYNFQKEWFEDTFIPWVNELPYKDEFSKVIMTWGNHDFVGERGNATMIQIWEAMTNQRLTILKNCATSIEYLGENGVKTLTVGGTPYCKVFGFWAFMVTDEVLVKKYNMLPKSLDVVISHDSPSINELGMIRDGFNAGVDAGNKILDEWIVENTPKYLFSGHIHSGNHSFEKIGETWMANVSMVNERYEPNHFILGFEIDRETKELITQYPIICNAKRLE